MKNYLMIVIYSLFLFTGVNIYAQKNESKTEKKEQREDRRKEEQVKIAQQNVANIETLNFSFYPSSIEPEFGVFNELTGNGNFYFTVDKTVLYINLPYTGRFYINPLSPENQTVNITSNKFLYDVQSTDNINIKVSIIPADLTNLINEGIKFTFYLNKNSGYARLVMTANNRQEITYTGTFK